MPGQEMVLASIRQVDTLSQLQEIILGAKLADSLFQLLQFEETRNLLRFALIKTYFAPEFHATLLSQASINLQSFDYSQKLIDQVKQAKESPDEDQQYQANVRDQGFRRAVVRVYEHCCAFCGVKMLTSDGHTAVDAAHIIPWSIGHNDDVRNGMALCGLCHWSFDEGMLSLSPKYIVLLSPELRTRFNVPGHLMTLESRRLLGPEEEVYWPDLESIRWHRERIFRKA